MRRSLLPGMRYPCRAPESNHLLTVRGATLQILATSPVVRTSLTFVALIAFLPPGADVPLAVSIIGVPPLAFRPNRADSAACDQAASFPLTGPSAALPNFSNYPFARPLALP